MKKSLMIGIIIVLFITGYIIFSTSSKKNINSPSQQALSTKESNESLSISQTSDKKASFAIFTNGTFRIFTASMYHNLSEDVYIQADNPNIVVVKKTGITWGDFFKTLPFSLTKDCLTTGTKETFCTNQNSTLKFYSNGVEENDLLNKEIHDGDKALITYGNENEKQIQKQIDKLNSLASMQR